MSRQSQSSSGRNLTLTEELERLEQSITLTLQEIDQNFNKAHRIVTASILPIVEQYGEHSKNVWEASKFWKQFFEASANVALSGYEDLADEAEGSAVAEDTTLDESTSQYNTMEDGMTVESSAYQEHGQEHEHEQTNIIEDSLLEDATITGSTPRPPVKKPIPPQFAGFDSPYQALRRELKDETTAMRNDFAAGGGAGDDDDDDDDDDTMNLAPQAQETSTRLPDMSMTPRSTSLLLDEQTPQAQSTARKHKDPLLYRVLDKTYRLQATPLKNTATSVLARGRSPQRRGLDEVPEEKPQRFPWEGSANSSPEMAVPKMRSQMYLSPLKTRIPGVSVQTPATSKKRDIFAEIRDKSAKGKEKEKETGRDEITWESDEDDELFRDMSPPKTVQFNFPPSRLLQTPAQEASRRIVDDILREADDVSVEYSPTMVKMSHDILDDTF